MLADARAPLFESHVPTSLSWLHPTRVQGIELGLPWRVPTFEIDDQTPGFVLQVAAPTAGLVH